MRFTIQRENILKPLQFVIGVVEKRQTLPVLSNVLMEAKNDRLSITATDLEVEIVSSTGLDVGETGAITLPARKFIDICRALPEEAQLDVAFDAEKDRVIIRSGKSRFNLATLPVTDFPNIEDVSGQLQFQVPQRVLKNLLKDGIPIRELTTILETLAEPKQRNLTIGTARNRWVRFRCYGQRNANQDFGSYGGGGYSQQVGATDH